MTTHPFAKRIANLPPYPFAELDRKKSELKAKGADIIDISIGDPDQPTPFPIVEALQKAVTNSEFHKYPSYSGSPNFRKKVADWYKQRFGVTLDWPTQVLGLIGSKEGIANIHYAFVNPGDVVLCPTPGYPVYSVATTFAGGTPYFIELKKENNFLPDLKSIPSDILKKAKLLHLNYPNNPTSAMATRVFFEEVVAFAKEHNIIVSHDSAYTEIYFSKEKPISFLEIEGAKEVGVEFHSISKTFNMTGWRLGMVCGNASIVAGLGKIKTNVDSGQFTAIQEAGIFALDHQKDFTPAINQTYLERREAFAAALEKEGFSVDKPEATFYLWMEVPKNETSESFATKVLEKAHVVATPGTAFGRAGEGYIRFTLTATAERLEEAARRIGKV